MYLLPIIFICRRFLALFRLPVMSNGHNMALDSEAGYLCYLLT